MQTEKTPGIQTYNHLQSSTLLHNIATGDTIDGHNLEKSYAAASLTKLYIAAATLYLVEQGQIDLRQYLSIKPSEFLQGNYGTGRLRWNLRPALWASQITGLNLFPPISLETFLKFSIRYSDNLAVLKVANHLGRPNLQSVLDGWGLQDTTILDEERPNPNVTTAEDTGRFLVNLGNGGLLEEDQALRFLKWMRKKSLPNIAGGQTTLLYGDGRTHENGLSFYHEAGFIIGRGSRRFVYTIMTEDKPIGDFETTYPQEERIKSYVSEMAHYTI